MRKRIWLLTLVIFFGLVIIARDPLVTKGIEIYLSRKMTSQGWSFESIARNKNVLNIKNLSYQKTCFQEVDASFHLSFFPLKFEPCVNVSDMRVEIDPEASDDFFHSILFALSNPKIHLKLSIEKGQLLGVLENPLYFSFQPGLDKKDLGTFYLENEENKPFLSTHFFWKQSSLISQIEIEKGRVSDLVKLLACFPDSPWKGPLKGDGEITASFQSSFDPKKGLEEMKGEIDLNKISISHPSLGLDFLSESMKGTVFFSPHDLTEKDLSFWEKVELFLTFENTHFKLNQERLNISIEDSLGEVRLKPQEDPYLKMGGVVVSNKLPIPFQIEGKGKIFDRGSVHLETAVDFFLKGSSPHLLLQFKQEKGLLDSLEIQLSDFSGEVFRLLEIGLPFCNLPQSTINAKNFEGTISAFFEQKHLKALKFSEVKSQEFSFSMPSEEFQTKKFNFSGYFEKNEKQDWDIISLRSEVENLNLFSEGKESLSSFSMKLLVEQGNLLPSYMEGICFGVWCQAQSFIEGENFLHLECKTQVKELFERFSKKAFPYSALDSMTDPIYLSLEVPAKEKFEVQGKCLFFSPKGEQEEISLKAALDRRLNRNIKDLLKKWDFSSLEGCFETQKLSSQTTGPYLRPFLGAFALDGFLKAEGAFNSEELHLEIGQASLNLSDGSWGVHAELGSEEKKAHLVYEYKEGSWRGEIPLNVLNLQNDVFHLKTEVRNSTVFFDGQQLWTDHLEAESFGTKFLGKLFVSPTKIHLASKPFEGSLASFKPILTKWIANSSASMIDGSFFVEDRSCVFEGEKEGNLWKWDWKVSIGLKDLSADLGKAGKVVEGKGRLEANALGDFKLKDIQGIYFLEDKNCSFALSNVQGSYRDFAYSDFSLLAKDNKREWGYVHGKVQKQKDSFLVSLASHSHILGLPVEVAPFYVNSRLQTTPIHLSSSLKLEQVPSYCKMWQEMGISISSPEFLKSCQGSVQIQAIYDLNHGAWKASLKSSEILYLNQMLGKSTALLAGDKKSVRIESFQLANWNLKGLLEKESNYWNASSLSLEGPQGKCTLKAKYFPTSQSVLIPSFSGLFASAEGKIQMQGSFEGSYKPDSSSLQGKGMAKIMGAFPSFELCIESPKEIPFAIDSQKGFQVEKSQWDLFSLAQKQKLGRASTKLVTFLSKEKRWLVQQASLTIPKGSYKELQSLPCLASTLKNVSVDQDIDLEAEIDISSQHKKISASLKNGTYQVWGRAFDLKQIKFLIEKQTLYTSLQTKYMDQPFLLQLQMNWEKESPRACVILKENQEDKGLTVQFLKNLKEGWLCESAEGSVKGVSLQLQRIQKELDKRIYDLKISADFSQILPVLSKKQAASLKKWGLGKGYSFHGLLGLNASSSNPLEVAFLKGDLIGQNFDFLGKSLAKLNAKVDFTHNRGKIYSIKLEDDLAHLSIKTVDLSYNNATGSWDLSAPIVYLKDFAPSLLVKGKKERGMEIKNLSLYDLKGSLNNLETLEASGALFFSSKEKKELSFWDVPLNVMKDLGLDPGLLTPVTGEAEFVLKRGCFYFTALRNVYSEGKRSQFYLDPGNDAYLSLDGSWHVDLAMKQNVVWKVTEDLILSIRGSVDNPKYSFKSNKRSR